MSCSLKIVFISPVSVKGLFTFKDKLHKKLLSGIVYKYKCGSFNVTYYGKTKRHFKIRIYKHLGFLHLTREKMKIDTINLQQFENTFYVATTLHSLKTFLF